MKPAFSEHLFPICGGKYFSLSIILYPPDTPFFTASLAECEFHVNRIVLQESLKISI